MKLSHSKRKLVRKKCSSTCAVHSCFNSVSKQQHTPHLHLLLPNLTDPLIEPLAELKYLEPSIYPNQWIEKANPRSGEKLSWKFLCKPVDELRITSGLKPRPTFFNWSRILAFFIRKSEIALNQGFYSQNHSQNSFICSIPLQWKVFLNKF